MSSFRSFFMSSRSHALFARAAVAAIGLIVIGAASPAMGGIVFDFNSGNGGFASTLNTATFDGPWVYGAVGVGGSGGWSTDGQSAEISHACTTDLTSPSLLVLSSGNVTLGFDHRYSFEFDGTRWDGGAVFVSLNGGAFTEVPGASFTANSYGGSVAANSASELAGQEAFTAASPGYAGSTFLTSTANLGTFAAGDSLQVRFRAAYDTNTSGGSPDWVVDNVVLSNIIPEPLTLSLLAMGSVVVLRRRRRA